MGLYCTTTSLQTLAVGTTFDSVTTALADKCITWSENEINKYLSKRYDIASFNTSGSVPPLVTTWCEWLSLGYLYQNYGRGGKESRERGKEYRDMAIENLTLVQEYKSDLLNTTGSVISDFSNTAYRVLSNTDTYTETFAEDDELAWSIDSNKLTDIKDSRD